MANIHRPARNSGYREANRAKDHSNAIMPPKNVMATTSIAR